MSGRLTEPGISRESISTAPGHASHSVTTGPSTTTSGPSAELPPPSAPPSRHGTFPAVSSRSASVSNILNPTSEQSHGRRRKASELHSPPSRPHLPPLLSDIQSTHVRSPSLSAGTTPAFSPNVSNHGRRIMTPKSPALHRAASVGQLNAPSGSIDAQLTPFPGSPGPRTYTIEPGRAGVPPLPAPILSARPSYTHSPSVARTRPSRRHEESQARSPSFSPRSGIPSQNPPAHATSRVDYQSAPASAIPQSAHSHGTEGDQLEFYGGSLISDRRTSGIPVTSAGQSAFQMMTLKTTSGSIQVPVEVQAASRVADEKRKRNAGASARFRARRKEKEKESSHTIAQLEMKVKDLSEDVEFYRQERTYLAGIILQGPAAERYFPRPLSPRHHRAAINIHAGPSRSTSVGYMSDPAIPHSPEDGRNVRRRTSTISLPMPDPATVGPGYHGQRYDMPPMGPHGQTRTQLPGPAALLAPAPQQPHYQQGPPEGSWTAYGGPSSAGPGDPSRRHH